MEVCCCMRLYIGSGQIAESEQSKEDSPLYADNRGGPGILSKGPLTT